MNVVEDVEKARLHADLAYVRLHYDRDTLIAALAAAGIGVTPHAVLLLDAHIESLWGQIGARLAGRYEPPGKRQMNATTEFCLGIWDFYSTRVDHPQLGSGGRF